MKRATYDTGDAKDGLVTNARCACGAGVEEDSLLRDSTLQVEVGVADRALQRLGAIRELLMTGRTVGW